MAIYLFAAQGRDGKVLAYSLLSYGVRRVFGLKTLPELAREKRGKPYFPDYPSLFFNLSHSGPFAFCGLGTGPLGVDIEQMRPCRAGLPRRVMSSREYEAYSSCADQRERFFSLWTLKESYCKCTGEGLAVPLRESEFLFSKDGKITSSRKDYRFRSYAGANWRAAACALGACPPREIIWVPDLWNEPHAWNENKGE
ncbi:MAG: 4'-phosphopantetheinyl transferase superfamily protein [Oscillospiraceae bacterium]|nr:4'-phosphopantetheinyl transferase superfamily protein [Oscillospiraceae bacterium]